MFPRPLRYIKYGEDVGQTMGTWFRLILAVFLLGSPAFLPGSPAAAETNQAKDETQALLEKGLTLHELDREIDRLNEKERGLVAQMADAERSLAELSARIETQNDRVKRLLQTTYTGDRMPSWMALLSARTWKDALYVFEQLKLIAERDRAALSQYTAAHREKAEVSAGLEQAELELRSTRTRYEDQRRTMTALQEEVARKLAQLPQKEELARQMSELNQSWETKGLPLFKQYFKALSETMQKLPELVASTPSSLTIKGFTYTFQIRDSELNAFIHARSPTLQQLNFTFGDGTLTASGREGDVSVSITGAYELETKPKNAIRFHIREIVYNGYKLPPSTMQTLESGSDLSFYPSKLASFLQATDLSVKNRTLSVTLKMSF